MALNLFDVLGLILLFGFTLSVITNLLNFWLNSVLLALTILVIITAIKMEKISTKDGGVR